MGKEIAEYNPNRALSTQQTFGALLEANRLKLETMLPAHISAKRLIRTALTCVMKSPKLLQCTGQSMLAAVMDAATLGLMPDGVLGEGAILPFKNEAKFVPMYQGLVKLAYNNPNVKSVKAKSVHENDEFEYVEGLEPVLNHRPPQKGPRGAMIGAYAIIKMEGVDPITDYMTCDEIDKIKNTSPGARSSDSPWNDRDVGYPRMGEKTVFKRVQRWVPKSPELAAAIVHDNQVEESVFDNVVTIPNISTATLDLAPGKPEEHTEPGAPVGPPKQGSKPIPAKKLGRPKGYKARIEEAKKDGDVDALIDLDSELVDAGGMEADEKARMSKIIMKYVDELDAKREAEVDVPPDDTPPPDDSQNEEQGTF